MFARCPICDAPLSGCARAILRMRRRVLACARPQVKRQRAEVHNSGASYYIWNMTMAAAADTIVLRCELGWAEVREVMAASRLLTLTRRSWLTAGVFFAALLAESIVLLRFVAARPAAAYGSHRGLLL